MYKVISSLTGWKNYCWQKSARQFESKLNLNHNAHVGVNDQIRSLEPLSRSTVRLPQIRRLTAGVKRAKLVQISIQKTCLTQILFLTEKWLTIKFIKIYMQHFLIKYYFYESKIRQRSLSTWLTAECMEKTLEKFAAPFGLLLIKHILLTRYRY